MFYYQWRKETFSKFDFKNYWSFHFNYKQHCSYWKMSLIESLYKKNQIAVLIDPEKCQSEKQITDLVEKIHFAKVDFVFIGGSTVSEKEFNQTISYLSFQL